MEPFAEMCQPGLFPSQTKNEFWDSFRESIKFFEKQMVFLPSLFRSNAAFDKATVKRMQDIQKLSAQEKGHVYAMLDAFLLKASIQKNLVAK